MWSKEKVEVVGGGEVSTRSKQGNLIVYNKATRHSLSTHSLTYTDLYQVIFKVLKNIWKVTYICRCQA